MTLLHAQKVRNGTQIDTSRMDDESYRELLSTVPKSMKMILELGSASGGQWPLLKEWAPEGKIYGIDLYVPLVDEAIKKGLPIYKGFVENMNMFPQETFDLVCSRHVMEHLGDVDAGMDEIFRVLKSGGFSAHVTPDMPYDDEPSHLNKWKIDVWQEKWLEHGFIRGYLRSHKYHGGEVHTVYQKP